MAVVFSIVVMTNTYGSTLVAVIDVLIGTIIGSVASAFFLSDLAGLNFWSMFIGMLGTSLFTLWKFPNAIKFSTMIFMVTIFTQGESVWGIIWSQFWQIFLGVIVSALINYFIFPSSAELELKKNIGQGLLKLKELYDLIIDGMLNNNYDFAKGKLIKKQLIELNEKRNALLKEFSFKHSVRPSDEYLNLDLDYLLYEIWECILAMEYTLLIREEDKYWQILSESLIELSDYSSLSMFQIANAIKNNLEQPSLSALDKSILNSRETLNLFQPSSEENMQDLLKFFTFFHNMQEMAKGILKLAKILE